MDEFQSEFSQIRTFLPDFLCSFLPFQDFEVSDRVLVLLAAFEISGDDAFALEILLDLSGYLRQYLFCERVIVVFVLLELHKLHQIPRLYPPVCILQWFGISVQ